jgi:hypothetical protein
VKNVVIKVLDLYNMKKIFESIFIALVLMMLTISFIIIPILMVMTIYTVNQFFLIKILLVDVIISTILMVIIRKYNHIF